MDSNYYKIFRCDRTRKTHPIDNNDPGKFKSAGGGVLIAVRTDLDIKSKRITLSCGAEILSVDLDFGNNRRISLSTCYQVGTLEDNNHAEIDKYLKTLAKSKKFHRFVIIGDFNLNKVSWPESDTVKDIQISVFEHWIM